MTLTLSGRISDGVTPKTDLLVSRTVDLSSTKQAEIRKIWLHAVHTDTHAIGWLPSRAFDTRAENGDLSAVYRNDDLVGWAMHSPSRSRGVMKLYQIWVRPDARILEHGRALITKIQSIARQTHCYMIEAWVAEDLPANLFWEAIGFKRKNWRHGKGVRNRIIWLWVALSGKTAEDLSGEILPPKSRKAEEWRKLKTLTNAPLPNCSNSGGKLTRYEEV